MPVSQAMIDAMTEALSHGERSVTTENETVEYRSVAELIKARNELLAIQASESAVAGTPRPRQIRISHGGRGFDDCGGSGF